MVHSSLADDTIRAAHLIPCPDIRDAVAGKLSQLGPDARVAVLPQSPLTIPYLA